MLDVVFLTVCFIIFLQILSEPARCPHLLPLRPAFPFMHTPCKQALGRHYMLRIKCSNATCRGSDICARAVESRALGGDTRQTSNVAVLRIEPLDGIVRYLCFAVTGSISYFGVYPHFPPLRPSFLHERLALASRRLGGDTVRAVARSASHACAYQNSSIRPHVYRIGCTRERVSRRGRSLRFSEQMTLSKPSWLPPRGPSIW